MSALTKARRPRLHLNVLFLSATVLVPACLVDNPAFDPRPRDAGAEVSRDAASDTRPGLDGTNMIDVRDASVPPDAAGRDAPPDANGDTLIISSSGRCDAKDPTLSLCLTFEGNIADQSARQIQLAGIPGFVPSPDGIAFVVKNATGLQSGSSDAFISPRLTVDAWVRLGAYPETQTQALVVVPDVISVLVTGQGEIYCDVGGIPLTGANKLIPLHTWTGVSCTYDGTAITILVNGLVAGSRGHSGWDPPVTQAPILVGSAPDLSPFTGAIDNLRFWKRRLPPAELCTASPDCSP